MKRVYQAGLAFIVASVLMTSTAWSEFNVNVNMDLGIPLPRIVIAEPPDFIMPPSLGFYIAVGTPYDIYRVDNVYYLYDNNTWYRGSYYDGPWRIVKHKHLPRHLRTRKYKEIRYIRDREYRHYRSDNRRYRGRHFKPVRSIKENLKNEVRPGHDGRHDRRDDRYDRRDDHRDRDDDRHDRRDGRRGDDDRDHRGPWH